MLIVIFFLWRAMGKRNISFRKVKRLAAFFALSVNESAYMAEIIRSGLASVDRGQILAGKTLGLRGDQIFRLPLATHPRRSLRPTDPTRTGQRDQTGNMPYALVRPIRDDREPQP